MTPEEQQAVRRALAAAPPADPMPPEVVARLEATIAELTANGTTGGRAPATVSDLEQRRRRRWPRVLVAAASVSVLGYGVGAILQDAGPQAETAMSDSAGADGGSDESGQQEYAAEGGAEPRAALPEAQEAPGLLAYAPVVELRRATLRRDVARHLAQDRVATSGEDALTDSDAKRYARLDGTCVLPEVRGGDEVLAARLEGRRATLVVRETLAGTRVAEVYWCGDGRTLLAQTELPARR